MTPEQQRERGDRAKRILEDELYVEAFAAVKEHLQRKWAETALDADKEREQLFLQVKLMEKLKGTLEYYMQNGTLAVFKIEQDKRRKNAGQY